MIDLIRTTCVQFPIGIDSERFIRALDLPQVKDHIKELKERFAGKKVNVNGTTMTDDYLALWTYYTTFSSYNLLMI